ncbi:MAG TPA: hypothetical protein VGB60_06955 [Brevundimonas sp.]|jgi:xanthosine utilization system XapX-like protein|uniref:hypothetical protein n=1 Tax=Brevundimonas sp. TaxID=1871086 RepID=UPI002EDA8BF3
MVYLDRLRSLLAGVAVGIIVALLYLRTMPDGEQALDELQWIALGMIFASAGLTLWLGRALKKKAA